MSGWSIRCVDTGELKDSPRSFEERWIKFPEGVLNSARMYSVKLCT